MKDDVKKLTMQDIVGAAKRIEAVVKHTPLQKNMRLSDALKASVYLKREDLQDVRSYKIRGAFNLMNLLTEKEASSGVVCASAGNHAQGVAFSAGSRKIHATIFMPATTPLQKINRVKHFGGKWVSVQLVGNTYDEAALAAKKFCKEKNAVYVHPFNDYRIIAGQGTVGKEIVDKLEKNIDYVLCPIGGGGLISGIATYIKSVNPKVKIIGVEPTGAASMYTSVKAGRIVTLPKIDTFVDGVAVKRVEEKTFGIVKKLVDDIVLVPEGKVCTTMVELYQNEGIVAEPAGALAIAATEQLAEKVKGKTVVCILSGGNNDILRYPEIMERSLVYQGRKHYFLITFAQKPGQLRRFVDSALGPTDDIVRFEYIKRTSKEKGPALVGIELAKKEDLQPLLKRMDKIGLDYTLITTSDLLYSYLI